MQAQADTRVNYQCQNIDFIRHLLSRPQSPRLLTAGSSWMLKCACVSHSTCVYVLRVNVDRLRLHLHLHLRHTCEPAFNVSSYIFPMVLKDKEMP